MATKPASKPKKKKKKKPVLSAKEKALAKVKKDHRSAVRKIFRSSGFSRVTGISDKPFTFDGQTGDVDDIFILENVIVIAEYTCAQTSDVGGI